MKGEVAEKLVLTFYKLPQTVSKKEWKRAIAARKKGTATKEQKEMLDNGHWKA